MSLVLNGTDGLSDVDGSAATPAIRGTDANTGIFFPAADTIAFAEGGAEVMRIDSSGNVGIGTSSPSVKLDIVGENNGSQIRFGNGRIYTYKTSAFDGYDNSLLTLDSNSSVSNYAWAISGAEKMRIDSSGNLLVGTTSGDGSRLYTFSAGPSAFTAVNTGNVARFVNNATGDTVRFFYTSTQVGSVSITTTTTAYNTSSDYRLKNTIAPMTGALAKVALLKPCTYKWNADGSDGEGFIAHELQAVVPDCVTGEKDAVDAEGNPQYQGIDVSFLVATLTAAIQELKAIVDAQGAEIAALKGTQP
jgi:hypothetical protein